ncbi:MAG: VWA domain-containing protein [Acidimicrobiia bacterium]|nr:VWA domain-containing protein [Acidimicrobiia bacterium]
MCGERLSAAPMPRRPFAVPCVLLVLAVFAGTTPAGQSPVFRGGVETVEVTVTVTDGNGRLITGLTRDDFQVYEDGVERPVTHFTGARLPVSLGIVLDISDSMVGQPIVDARAALDRFVGELLAAEDEAFIATFNHSQQVVAPWTSPPGKLTGLLDDVLPTGSTAIYDAVAAAATLFEVRRSSRSALVLVSDGADTASDLSLGDARNRLQRSDPFVYAIAVDSSLHPRVSTRVNPDALRELTGPSGGYTEVVRDASDLGPATARIANELNHQYTLGYSPPRPPDGSWRSIRVRMRNRDLMARARRGYYAVR